mmetsp:Transcript_42966/g.121780  ORF Transcript_42966/g.121780 Transcript_42966/m.121780 type:complete len:145 (-) Transcript_42966:573-1007(-)
MLDVLNSLPPSLPPYFSLMCHVWCVRLSVWVGKQGGSAQHTRHLAWYSLALFFTPPPPPPRGVCMCIDLSPPLSALRECAHTRRPSVRPTRTDPTHQDLCSLAPLSTYFFAGDRQSMGRSLCWTAMHPSFHPSVHPSHSFVRDR